THDNTASILKTFDKMNGKNIYDPDKLLIVLDHNAPPNSAKLANDYQAIRDFVNREGIKKFYDAGKGICHQIMSYHAKPGMIIVGSDSHTCTAGAFNVLAAGIDRTEAAGLWKTGETWFRVPPSIKITLNGKLKPGVYAKDISLWIIGMIGSAGANYTAIEFHGEGLKNLSISDRMTLANLASEMGAKNAVFPADEVLKEFFGENQLENAIWADPDANYEREITIDLEDVYPLVAVPHHVDNIKSVPEVEGISVQQGLIGTCTNGRIEDIRVAAEILKEYRVKPGFQLLIIPASKEIYLQAIKEGLVESLIESGANFLSASCGPCLGTGQGIPADGMNVISTANRNFIGRMGNKNASIYLASPATVAWSSIKGKITDPRLDPCKEKYPYGRKISGKVEVSMDENRRKNDVWDYSDADNINTDQMFAGNLTYNILSSDAMAIVPHLFEGFDPNFSKKARKGDLIVAGHNFGCGSSREHPAVGLACLGIRAVIAKSVNRIFFRSAINQGLLIIVCPEAVESFKETGIIKLDPENNLIITGERKFRIPALPEKLNKILEKKGLVNYILNA
ncbi:MAG: aconitase/3-isopropylmalate dehydratase large subunit family protein, partial [Bacteroidota bacterium]